MGGLSLPLRYGRVQIVHLVLDLVLEAGKVIVDLLHSIPQSGKIIVNFGGYRLAEVADVVFYELTHYLVRLNPSFVFCDHDIFNLLQGVLDILELLVAALVAVGAVAIALERQVILRRELLNFRVLLHVDDKYCKMINLKFKFDVN